MPLSFAGLHSVLCFPGLGLAKTPDSNTTSCYVSIIHLKQMRILSIESYRYLATIPVRKDYCDSSNTPKTYLLSLSPWESSLFKENAFDVKEKGGGVRIKEKERTPLSTHT